MNTFYDYRADLAANLFVSSYPYFFLKRLSQTEGNPIMIKGFYETDNIFRSPQFIKIQQC